MGSAASCCSSPLLSSMSMWPLFLHLTFLAWFAAADVQRGRRVVAWMKKDEDRRTQMKQRTVD